MDQPRVQGNQSDGKGKEKKREDYDVKLGQVSLKLPDIVFP